MGVSLYLFTKILIISNFPLSLVKGKRDSYFLRSGGEGMITIYLNEKNIMMKNMIALLVRLPVQELYSE